MENGAQRSGTVTSNPDWQVAHRPMAMEIANGRRPTQRRNTEKRKAGNYASARSSSSQSMQIPLHTSSAAHQANRFLSCSGDPTSLAPLNVAMRWRMESSPRSSAMSPSLLQISSWYLS